MADLTYKEYRSKGNCTSVCVELFCPLSGKVFRLQLHKTKHSLALRKYLDSFSFSLFSFFPPPSPPLVPPCNLHPGCAAKLWTLCPWNHSRYGGADPEQPDVAVPALACVPCPTSPSQPGQLRDFTDLAAAQDRMQW